MPVPGAIVSDSVLDHGPVGLVENVPWVELELSVTTSGAGVVTACPVLVTSLTPIAADGVPAATVCAGVVNARTG